MQEGRLRGHKCIEAARNNPYGNESAENIVIELDERASLSATKYLSTKHELEIWKSSRNVDYAKLKIKVKRLRTITFSLMDGKSMKQAKKQAF